MTNFKLSALILAATTTLAAPAFANDALAESLGVEPGKYTNNQLIRLQAAMSSVTRSKSTQSWQKCHQQHPLQTQTVCQ